MIDAAPPPKPSIEIVVASRGISKGLAQTNGPQIVVRPEIAFGKFFVGGYAKNISSPTADVESAAMIGLRTKAAGFDVSAYAALKRLLGTSGGVDATALEVSGTVARRWGPFGGRVSATWSPDDLAGTGKSMFLEAGSSYSLTPSLSLSAAIARRSRDGGPDYTAFNAGGTYSLGKHLAVDIRWYGTNRTGINETYHNRLVGSVRAKF